MLIDLINILPLFTIVLFRTASMLFFSPIYNQISMPVMVKIGLAVVISIVIYPTVDRASFMTPDSLIAFILIIFKEVAIGFVIGYGATLMFGAFVVAGDLISGEIGLQMAEMSDPLFGGQVNQISQLIQMLGFLLLLAINGHHWVINALALSYKSVPITEFFWSGATMSKVLILFQGLFVSAIKLAAPLMIILSLIVVVTGIISRATPEIGILMVVFPLKILVGFLILAVTFPFLVRTMEHLLNALRKDLFSLVGGM
ncbi:MAG: flagellar biosynthetic protein FliR [Candidatus Scalindua sp. AMX11]|nr:MAG: flagellar biosynthetic protein FliR [Candidatus Scalindua sp.]NOG85787.1 flagellar biosynthetic protein FliR [Planctomycetota bacterium]RZV97037.1 MAG: flagellar biosynthetic protein FliR [Candidatus Scalindua sp. SCAELEC01]TDE66349.1 MAG: flagellar biosynthetic protein FliR [Candidatus Scalindua sp. AMX11]GJQ58259.1 MAG: flagellar biosynthetic protein FliR [Candidatus Scalindua sp.]